MSSNWMPQSTGRLKKFLLLLCLAGLSASCANGSQAELNPVVEAAPLEQVVALGRLAPKGEVIKLSVSNAEDSRVNQIMVEEGDWVESGQVIAILQGYDRRVHDLEEARRSVGEAEARLAQVQAGDAKQAEIAAQEANIARLQAELRTQTLERQALLDEATAQLREAQITYDRNQALQEAGAVSLQNLDLAQEEYERAQAVLSQRQAQLDNTLQTIQEQLSQERKILEQLKEVRPVDIQVAKAELARAEIAVLQRQEDLEDTRVKAPIAGQVLRINTRIGEQVNTQQGIIELGQTDQMYAIAEIYETEILHIRLGQRAGIQSENGGFTEEIQGTIEHIGLQVGTGQLQENASDPSNDRTRRVIEVKIRIDPEDSSKVAMLTNMQVRISIDLDSAEEEASES